LSTDDLAEIFGVTRATICSWAKSGRLPPGRRYGKFLRFHPSEIQPYL
jgi:excisionase family DNA binding protein